MPSKPKYRVGIIGLSHIAWRAPDNHLDAYLGNPRCKVVAVCDINEKIMRIYYFTPFSSELGCLVNRYNKYTDYKDMLAQENLDIVSICTPTDTHAQITIDCAEAGVRAIYCEKPMADTLEDCQRMIDACKANRTILQINHQRHFMRPVMRFSRDLLDTGTHVFDLLQQLFGEIFEVQKDYVIFKSGKTVELDYVPTMAEHIFELDCAHKGKKMIPYGVQALVDCLDTGRQSSSDGYKGMSALKYAKVLETITLEYKRL